MTEENSYSQPIFINGRELEMLAVTQTHILKRCKKKCGWQEVYNLMQESLDYEMSIESFNETLHSLTDSKSIILNTIRNQECLFLLTENENNEENHINEEFNKFKNSFLEEFYHSKRSFFSQGKQL